MCIIIRDDMNFLLSQGAVLHGKCGDLPAGCGPPGNIPLSYFLLLSDFNYSPSLLLLCSYKKSDKIKYAQQSQYAD